MTDDDPNSVFGANITVDDDNNDSSSSNQKYSTQSREQRTFQSEQDFQQQKANWTPKVDTKDVLPSFVPLLFLLLLSLFWLVVALRFMFLWRSYIRLDDIACD